MKMARRQKVLFQLIVLLALGAGFSLWLPVSAQVSVDKTIRDYKLPSEIPWVERNGSASLNIYGNPSEPGTIYVSLLRRPFDNWAAPHTHPTERYSVILEGTFLAGTGPVMDKNRVEPLKAGTVVAETPNRMHYDGVGEDGVTLFFIGRGGANGPRPNEEPRAPGGPNVDPTARLAKKLEDMKWTKAADGSTFTNVFGDPAKEGIYVQFVRRPANSWSTAHKHANDQFEWVMNGKMYIGTGATVDKNKTVELPKGSYIHDMANGVHYEGTKGEDLLLLVTGVGPV